MGESGRAGTLVGCSCHGARGTWPGIDRSLRFASGPGLAELPLIVVPPSLCRGSCRLCPAQPSPWCIWGWSLSPDVLPGPRFEPCMRLSACVGLRRGLPHLWAGAICKRVESSLGSFARNQTG